MRIPLVTALTVAALCFAIGALSGYPRASLPVAVLLLALAFVIYLYGPH
jgi:hypothetical protein